MPTRKAKEPPLSRNASNNESSVANGEGDNVKLEPPSPKKRGRPPRYGSYSISEKNEPTKRRKYNSETAEGSLSEAESQISVDVGDNKDAVEGTSEGRSARRRVPTRKVLESKMTESLLKAAVKQPRKSKTSVSESVGSSASEAPQSQQFDEKPSVDDVVEEPLPEVSEEPALEEEQVETVAIQMDQEDHVPSPGVVPEATSEEIVVDTPSTSGSQQVIDHRPLAPGEDLPEEHRPKDRARPVIMSSTRVRTDFRKPLTPYMRTLQTQEDAMMEMGDVIEGTIASDDNKKRGYAVYDESGQMMYEMADDEFVEEVEFTDVPDGVDVIEEQEVQNADGSTSIVRNIVPRELPPTIDGPSNTLKQENSKANDNDDDDEAPPRLVPELGPTGPETGRRAHEIYLDVDNMVRVQSPGGTQQYVHVSRGMDGSEIYYDADGEEVQMVEEQPAEDLRTVEFNFLDSKNICCGLCGEIVPYDNLMSSHLPQMHPEVLGDGTMNLEEVPYETWLRDKLYHEKKNMESSFRTYDIPADEIVRMPHRTLRKVSQIRVNPIEMTLPQLEIALKKKMIEKMGRKVPVALVDKQHARCGICNAVVSLNKKFEIVHLVRHFNAWHPSAHRCAGSWQNRPHHSGSGKPLSIQDFAVIDVSLDVPDNLQCIWCGMFMDRNALAMHFTEVHPDEIEVPKCLLCMQELVINARLLEKYGEDFEVILPDEFHVKCQKFDQTFSTEAMLDKAIAKKMAKLQLNGTETNDDDDDDEDANFGKDMSYTNSRMQFGRRNKPKRSFVQPCFRQACPTNSEYVEAVSECQWRCKLCSGNIFGAVISAGAIKHYKQHHPGEMENMQYELCKARLERVSDGCMEFVHAQLVECLICNLTYALHKPYNMCRGIRHLKSKHPEMMPEWTGNGGGNNAKARAGNREEAFQMNEIIEEPDLLARFKNEYNMDVHKIQAVYGSDGEPVYVLLNENEDLDPRTAQEVISSLEDGETIADRPLRRTQPTLEDFDENDPFGEMGEEEELIEIEQQKYETAEAHANMDNTEYVTDEQVMHSQQEEVIEEGVEFDETVEHYEEIYDENYLQGGEMDEQYLDEDQMNFMETSAYEEHPN